VRDEKECADPSQCVTEALAESGRDRDALASLIRKAGQFFAEDAQWKARQERRAQQRRDWEQEITGIAKRAAADAAANREELTAVRHHLETLPPAEHARELTTWWAEQRERIRRCRETRQALARDLLRYLVLGLVGLVLLALALGLPEAIRRAMLP